MRELELQKQVSGKCPKIRKTTKPPVNRYIDKRATKTSMYDERMMK